MDATLMEFQASNEELATELVTRINRVIDLAQASVDPSIDDAEQIITEARDALREVAAFFEVDVPGAAE